MSLKFHDSDGIIKRYVGVEIEFSRLDNAFKAPLVKCLNKWGGVLKSDCSIRPEYAKLQTCRGNGPCRSGWLCYDCRSDQAGTIAYGEINTAPARGDLFVKQINEICDILKAGKGSANKSCGLHVHIDARDFEPMDLMKTAILWEKIEPAMFKKVASHRRTNDFCAPWNKKLMRYVNVKKDGPLKSFIKMYDNSKDNDKYCSLNFSSIDEYGTLENRMSEGTVDAKKIIKWATLNAKVLDFAKNSSFEAISKRVGIGNVERFGL